MKQSHFKIAACALMLAASCQASAWDHSIKFGYGSSSDPNHTQDTNSGFFLDGSIMSLSSRDWYNMTLDASLGDWESTGGNKKDLFTVAATVDFRAYLLQRQMVHMYAYASTGPGYISERQFGQNRQGSHFSFQSTFGAGFELGKERHVDLALNFIHFSNAYLIKPNEGYNIYYVVTLGYLF